MLMSFQSPLIEHESRSTPGAFASAILVSWNARDYLVGCIDSLRQQLPAERLEIIIVDNGSSDRSVEEVRRRFTDVVIIENHQNVGFAKANNIGIAQSTGDYLF